MGALSRVAGLVKGWIYPPKGSLTRYLLRRHCQGRGLEVGPGLGAYGDLRRTVLLDKFPHRVGRREIDIVSDAGSIPKPDGSFDYLISAHCLEHCPDTLAVLEEWVRVVRPGGTLFLILPHGERTFDRGRPLTELAHHIEDHARGVDESDPSHWEDFARHAIEQHDHAWTAEARREDGSWDFEWIAREGHLHYHVWTQNEMIDLLKHVGCRIRVVLDELPDRPDSFLVVAETGESSSESKVLRSSTHVRRSTSVPPIG